PPDRPETLGNILIQQPHFPTNLQHSPNSFLSPRSITDKLKPVIRKMKRYATGVLVVFVLIYTCISYSVSSVLYQLLKMQANSISIKDESLETKNEKSQ